MEHVFTTATVKQYNSTYKHILFVDSEPVAITESNERMSQLISYAQGYDVKISDGKVKKILDKFRKEIY